MVSSVGLDKFDWGWMCMMKGGWMCLHKGKKTTSRMKPLQGIRSGGDCGPDTAAWLLNEHGPALYRARSPETCSSVRHTLHQAWEIALRDDASGDEGKAFVQQRLDQVPHAMVQQSLDEQVATILQALHRGEEELSSEFPVSEGDSPETICDGGTGAAAEAKEPKLLPYWFLPSDWARLAEAYQVDFVLHGLPGTENCNCSYCGCSGHVHVGPRKPGTDMCLHVGWRGTGRKRGSSGGSGDQGAWGHWEPLGAGPITAPLPRQKSSIESEIDASNIAAEASSQAHETSNPTSGSMVENILQATLSSFDCVSQDAGQSCQKKVKDCCDTNKRASSDDNFSDLSRVDAHGKQVVSTGRLKDSAGDVTDHQQGGICSASSEVTIHEDAGSVVVSPRPASSRKERGSCGTNAGARFSVMLEGTLLGTDAAQPDDTRVHSRNSEDHATDDMSHLTRFKSSFLSSVAHAAGVSPTRVRILDVGQPLDTCLSAWSPKKKAMERTTPRTPDTGAGVLSFLTDGLESPVSVFGKSPVINAPPCSPASPPTQRQLNGNTVRILAVIREPQAECQASSIQEEPHAMMALELVVTELADPSSGLQQALKSAAGGEAVRIWCPEAEGSRRGPHRMHGALAARSRRGAGTVARLRRAG
jgi:hypothetical protein